MLAGRMHICQQVSQCVMSHDCCLLCSPARRHAHLHLVHCRRSQTPCSTFTDKCPCIFSGWSCCHASVPDASQPASEALLMIQIRRLLLSPACHLLRLQGPRFNVLAIHYSKASHKAAKSSHRLKLPASVAIAAIPILEHKHAAELAWATVIITMASAHCTTEGPPPRRARLPHQVPLCCQQSSCLVTVRTALGHISSLALPSCMCP